VDVLQAIFLVFKALQVAVFVGWCVIYGNGSLWPENINGLNVLFGAVLIVSGQALNLAVFYRLSKIGVSIGVFYGNKLGHKLPWSRKFPFSCLEHPQYFGALLSICGFFLVMRFPHDDWCLIPIIETCYYGLAAYFER
jgi:protein-S-isoprenylcysteine O-methyltransferase Ste14